MATEFIERYEANLFTQTDPADPFAFLTCTGIGNITIPKGARTIVYKQDLRRSGRLVAAGAIQGVADFVTASITRPLESVNNFLHEQDCPFNVRINWACRGTRTVFSNYELGALLFDAAFTTGAIETPGAGEGDNARINATGDLSATQFTYVYPLAGEKVTMTSTTDVYSIAVVPAECASKCGAKVGLGEDVWAGLEYTSYTVGYLLHSTDYGATWTSPAWHPFSVGGDISSIVIVDAQNGYRVIVSDGTALAGPAEISYSDDQGATGTDVVVGAVNGQTIQMLRKDIRGRVWAAASAGDIYVSTDNGVTWTEVGSGATAQDLYDIVFYDEYIGYAVGDANAFVYTTNGGTTWVAGTGPSVGDNLVSCDVNYDGHLYVTNDDAEMWRSTDGGDTWGAAPILDLVGTMPMIRFDEDFRYFGYLASNSAAPVGTIYRSEDAGNTWAAIGVPATDYANTGIHCVAICDPNFLYAGGIAAGPLSMIAKFDRQS